MRILRDVRESTKLLILLEITTHRHSRLKSIAEKVGLTVQGVSDYLKSLSSEGLIHRVEGIYAATMKGVDLLQERFKELREFVERAYSKMRILDTCAAVAGEDILEGERVGLFMEDAYLVAYPGRESSSHGRSLHSARKGEDIALVNLEGIVELSVGKITLLRIPGAREGGTRAVDLPEAHQFLQRHLGDKIAVNDAVARALALKLGLEPDFEFAAIDASVEAALRGLDVLLIVSEDSSSEAVSAIEAANEDLKEKVSYHVASLPTSLPEITGTKSKSSESGVERSEG
ncbi:MAG: winged helix-turn-helix domain-containing protein [Thermoplasmata archaeon]